MKINRLDKKAVRSNEKVAERLSTISEKELKAVVGSLEEGCCNYNYCYGSSTVVTE